ncbi:unnamed protein product [Urochloa humidicola]
MSSLPQDVDAGTGSGPPVAWWSAATQVESDVVLSGAVLLFVALAFVFVVYHYFTISRRAGAARQQQRGTLLMRGGDTAAGCRGGGGSGGVDAATLRVMPVTVYCRAKDGEALECAVCLAELADGEAARFLPRCGHGFHAECVDLWLTGHTTCPLCRVAVDVDRAAGSPLLPAAPPPSSLALPPALPEPANYPTNLPTNVLFWGSHDAVENVVVAAGGGGGQRSSRGAAGAPAAAAALVIVEVRDRETAPAPRGGGAEKARELARLSSLRRLWNRGRHDAAAAAASSSSCPQTSMATDPTEQAPATALDIWNLT